MRLLTRSDFDGLVCATLLKEAGIIDNWKFVHPKDLQDGLVDVTPDDILANVPFVEGCGLWFDHHSSELERNAFKGKYKGESRNAKSAARVIYDYYGGATKFPQFGLLLSAVDKTDSGLLTREEILEPIGWVLIGFIMDPRTGLGRFRDFRISNYQLMEQLIDHCAYKSLEEILDEEDVVERIELYNEQKAMFIKMLKAHTKVDGNTIFTDLRGVNSIYCGNRFLIYSLYPEQNLSVWIVDGKGGKGCSVAVGYSILNRSCSINIGTLMLKYGGGGHKMVGTCQFSDETISKKLPQLLREIKELNLAF